MVVLIGGVAIIVVAKTAAVGAAVAAPAAMGSTGTVMTAGGSSGAVCASAVFVPPKAAAITTAALINPVALLAVVGCSPTISFDCWKPILHNNDTAPSQGKFFGELLLSPLITDCRPCGDLCYQLINVWDEVFVLTPLYLSGQLAFHATKIEKPSSEESQTVK